MSVSTDQRVFTNRIYTPKEYLFDLPLQTFLDRHVVQQMLLLPNKPKEKSIPVNIIKSYVEKQKRFT